MTRLDTFIRDALLLKLHVAEEDLTLPQEACLVSMIQEVYDNRLLANETFENRIEHVIKLYMHCFVK